ALRDPYKRRDRGLRRVRNEAPELNELREIVEPRGEMPEKIADRVDVHALEELRRLPADAGNARHRKVERARRALSGDLRQRRGHVVSMVRRVGQRWKTRRSWSPNG